MTKVEKEVGAASTNGAPEKVQTAPSKAKKAPTIEEIEAKIDKFQRLAEAGRARDRWQRKAEELKGIKSDLDEAKNLTDFENSDFSLMIRNPHEREFFKVTNQSVVADFCDFLLVRIAAKIEELDIELMNA